MSASNASIDELNAGLDHHPAPGTLLYSVWGDSAFGPSVEDAFSAPSVGPDVPAQEVCLAVVVFSVIPQSVNRSSTTCTLWLLSTLPLTGL